MAIMKNRGKRIEWIDFLRTICAFAVVVTHIAQQIWHTGGVGDYNWQVFNFFESLSRCAVPIFVMISGWLYLNKNLTIQDIITKYISKYAILFGVWGGSTL